MAATALLMLDPSPAGVPEILTVDRIDYIRAPECKRVLGCSVDSASPRSIPSDPYTKILNSGNHHEPTY